jgi:hypothetical protein
MHDAGATDLAVGGAAPSSGFAPAAAAAVADAGVISLGFVAPGQACGFLTSSLSLVAAPVIGSGGFQLNLRPAADTLSAPLPLRTDGEPAPCPPALKRPAGSVPALLSNCGLEPLRLRRTVLTIRRVQAAAPSHRTGIPVAVRHRKPRRSVQPLDPRSGWWPDPRSGQLR